MPQAEVFPEHAKQGKKVQDSGYGGVYDRLQKGASFVRGKQPEQKPLSYGAWDPTLEDSETFQF